MNVEHTPVSKSALAWAATTYPLKCRYTPPRYGAVDNQLPGPSTKKTETTGTISGTHNDWLKVEDEQARWMEQVQKMPKKTDYGLARSLRERQYIQPGKN
jgi:hypothetical protein